MKNALRVDQKREQVRRILTEKAALFAMQGTVVETWRQQEGQRRGPYGRLAFREEGIQRSIYLGADSELIAEVRGMLEALQRPARERQQVTIAMEAVRRALRRERAARNRELEELGLKTKGNQIWGWRRLSQIDRRPPEQR